jgi:predicted dithiol-disulfide oxidoreductase (DUF899 family)
VNPDTQAKAKSIALLAKHCSRTSKSSSIRCAAKRRQLPLGGQLKEDYVFQWATEGKVGKPVRF